jgi:hypothetical protein
MERDLFDLAPGLAVIAAMVIAAMTIGVFLTPGLDAGIYVFAGGFTLLWFGCAGCIAYEMLTGRL